MKNTALSSIALTDLAVISLTGADATSFLQSQLTQDVAALDADHAALAGYCTARGRLLASMIVVQKGADQSDGWLLLTKADAALAFAQRLRMFVLRAKVDITISEIGVTGVYTDRSAAAGAEATVTSLPQPNTESPGVLTNPGSTLVSSSAVPAFSVVRRNGEVWISAPGRDTVSCARWWLIDHAAAHAPSLSDIQTSEADIQAWQAQDIAAGLPWVQAATQEAFIPQTINLDLIHGISFTKGCYPGQEVVARSHYRGTIKRRMAYATGAAVDTAAVPVLIGCDTFDASRPGQPRGRVINAAVGGDRLHVLMEVQLADVADADFRIGSEDGPTVTISDLPYSIDPADKV